MTYWLTKIATSVMLKIATMLEPTFEGVTDLQIDPSPAQGVRANTRAV